MTTDTLSLCASTHAVGSPTFLESGTSAHDNLMSDLRWSLGCDASTGEQLKTQMKLCCWLIHHSPSTVWPGLLTSHGPGGWGPLVLMNIHRKTYLVIDITVGEHGIKILHTLWGSPIIVVLKPPFNSTHVHRLLYNFVIILNKQTNKIQESELLKNKWFLSQTNPNTHSPHTQPLCVKGVQSHLTAAPIKLQDRKITEKDS